MSTPPSKNVGPTADPTLRELIDKYTKKRISTDWAQYVPEELKLHGLRVGIPAQSYLKMIVCERLDQDRHLIADMLAAGYNGGDEEE